MAAPAEGSVVDGRYRLDREIARGGTSIVYQAEHLYSGRRVALKLLSEEYAADEACRARLHREARALTLARHPNVVDVLDAGGEDGDPVFLVMEMLEGRALDGIITARKRLSPADAVHVGVTLCDALSLAHARGLVHRDIKPSNVMIVRDDTGRETLKLIDFGIAAVRGEKRAATERKLTQQRALLGTPEYMSPEQLRLEEDIGHRSDLYGVAVTIFECLTGSVPFSGVYAEILLRVAAETPPPLRTVRPDVPAALSAAVARGLARDPAQRFPVASAFARALARSLGDSPKTHFPLLGGAGAAAAVYEPEAETKPEQSHLRVRVTAPAAPPTPRPPPPPRVNRRVPYVAPLRFIGSDGKVISGRTEDISEGGVLAFLAQTCWDGDRGSVTFAPPGVPALEFPVVVRWVRQGRGGVAAGLAFVSIPPLALAAIATYVRTAQHEAEGAME